MSDIVSDYRSFLKNLVHFRSKDKHIDEYLTMITKNDFIIDLNEEIISEIHDKLFNKYQLDVNQYFYHQLTFAMKFTNMYPYISKYIDYSDGEYFLSYIRNQSFWCNDRFKNTLEILDKTDFTNLEFNEIYISIIADCEHQCSLTFQSGMQTILVKCINKGCKLNDIEYFPEFLDLNIGCDRSLNFQRSSKGCIEHFHSKCLMCLHSLISDGWLNMF